MTSNTSLMPSIKSIENFFSISASFSMANITEKMAQKSEQQEKKVAETFKKNITEQTQEFYGRLMQTYYYQCCKSSAPNPSPSDPQQARATELLTISENVIFREINPNALQEMDSDDEFDNGDAQDCDTDDSITPKTPSPTPEMKPQVVVSSPTELDL